MPGKSQCPAIRDGIESTLATTLCHSLHQLRADTWPILGERWWVNERPRPWSPTLQRVVDGLHQGVIQKVIHDI